MVETSDNGVGVPAKACMLFIVALFTRCTHREATPVVTIEVRPETFIVDGQEVRTPAALTAALNQREPAATIDLKPQAGVSDARVTSAVDAIHRANPNAAIAMVGNEVFR